MLWEHQPFEPIEQVVRQHADHQTARVYDHGLATHAGKIKNRFWICVFVNKNTFVAVSA